MKIAILGGSGRTGQRVIEEGLKRGYEIFALVRSPDKVQIDNAALHLIQGSPTNLEDVRKTLHSVDAVVSALNVNRASDLPWAKVISPNDLISSSIKNAIEVMQKENIKRIVSISAYGARDTRAAVGAFGRLFFYHTKIKFAYLDHERQEELLEASDLDFTAIRPTRLSEQENSKEIVVSIQGVPKPRFKISRRNLARFIIDIIENGKYVRQFPVLSEH
ncbi:MAG: putative NADH-flavin reductase [Promethearchaeota archaeon CR_4]|nr:MAG: putative NADH-flavin reductase [Candidatus Lokiarchaeota archaeon CR_4]